MKGTLSIFRLAFVVALLVGLGGLFHVYPMSRTLIDTHIVAGLIMLVAVVWLAIDTKATLVVVSAILIIASGLIPILSIKDPLTVRIFHIVIMIAAVGLVEMGVARFQRRQIS